MTAPASLPPGLRCAAHPARPAADRCPVCARPRCGADVRPSGCAVCATAAAPVPDVPQAVAGELERLLRGTLAAYYVALVGAVVASEYVQAPLLGYLGPFVVGVVCGAAALRGAATDGRGRLGTRVRGVAAGLALLGVALAFRIEGSQGLLSAGTLLPYLAAVAGALLWTVPPRRRPAQGAGTEV